MKYTKYLGLLKDCPFCILKKEEIIKKNKYAKVILAKAPYHKDHLLVVPNKHALKMSELTDKEKSAVFELVVWAEKKLRKYHGCLSILYREGDKERIGKSIDHFHINVIPDEQIGSVRINNEDRNIFSENTYVSMTKKAKEKFR